MVDNETEDGRVCIDSADVGTVRCWESVTLTTVPIGGAMKCVLGNTAMLLVKLYIYYIKITKNEVTTSLMALYNQLI